MVLASQQPFSLSSHFPTVNHNYLLRVGITALEKLSGLSELQSRYQCLPPCHNSREFLTESLRALGIDYRYAAEQLEYIPKTGPVIVVANHPFGGLDGFILAHLLTGIRQDVKVLANYHLQRIPEMQELLLGVDPFGREQSWRKNLKPLRESIRLLQQGGLLLVFPAGEVSHYQLRRRQITDPHWSDTVGRLVTLTEASVVPAYFHGRNSLTFNMAGVIHPLLRTVLLPRELVKKINTTIDLSIGKAIAFQKLKRLEGPGAVTRYLRLRTYMLSSKQNSSAQAFDSSRDTTIAKPLIPAIPVTLLSAEIANLPAAQRLHEANDMQVFVAGAAQIPWVLQEIGRLREETFRLAGEGTGESVDIDLFDTYYQHLFIWNKSEQHIVGAYRLGLVDKILQGYGKKGLYTYSLFKYPSKLMKRLGPALELGRSFIRAEYQRSFLPLNLLWKGIGSFVCQHKTPVLFGPVSISKDYTLTSRKLIVDCLQRNNFESSLARRVKPRRPFRARLDKSIKHPDLLMVRDIELISDMVSQLEKDEKGVPVLVRQYLKLGGKFLGFNMDADFSDVVDGLIVVDLRGTDYKTLAKYMGKEQAGVFLNHFNPSEDTEETDVAV